MKDFFRTFTGTPNIVCAVIRLPPIVGIPLQIAGSMVIRPSKKLTTVDLMSIWSLTNDTGSLKDRNFNVVLQQLLLLRRASRR